MSRLGEYEEAIVAQLASAMIGATPAFSVVRGASGGYRPALRDWIRRERVPGACVAFIEEDTAPETRPSRLGPYFAVLVRAATLREAEDPRRDGADTHGAFTLIDVVRERLDDWEIVSEQACRNIRIRFADADEQSAVYEILYRITPIASAKAPGAVTELAAALVSGTTDGVQLTWDAPGESADHGNPTVYKVFRKLASESTFVLQGAVGSDLTTLDLNSQPKGELLTYYILASNAGGDAASGTLVTITL